jgi:hypothetical protein
MQETSNLLRCLRSYYSTFFQWQNKFLTTHPRTKYYELQDGFPIFENYNAKGQTYIPTMMNLPIQGNGAVILRKAVCLFYDERSKLPSADMRIIFTMHDEMAVMCPSKYEEAGKTFTMRAMQNSCRYYFPQYEPLRVEFAKLKISSKS